jgi:hypothetical protein
MTGTNKERAMPSLPRLSVIVIAALLTLTVLALPAAAAGENLVRSTRSGPWSAPDTWEGGCVPVADDKVQVRTGHTVVYDVAPDLVIRSLHIAGTLTFAPDKDTRLNVGLIRIQAGDSTDEEGFDCTAHIAPGDPKQPRPALLVGTPERPIAAGHTALIRLHYIAGMDRESCPAIVCCGGRMDFHGAPMSRTWVKLGATAGAGTNVITLAEGVQGWRVGDRVILTATTRQIKVKKTFRPSVRDNTQTEERTIQAIDGLTLTLDRPLAYEHLVQGEYRGDIANLSRNVVIESADPQNGRGHTMYHRGSAGSISYAEFRHLGKEGVLGRYALHYHLAGNSMRGSYVQGASIWDSANRWLTIHGTNYLVVRDCVGYHSKGHGFFLEDGTEVYNILDRNLAVQACGAKPLPKQVLPFDGNDGAGFWWANSLNSFTRNVACECDEYGFRFEVVKNADFDPVLPVLQADGSRKKVDIRTLPFVRFEDNESHCQRRHAFNLGGFAGVPSGENHVGGVGPDAEHPFVIRNMRCWNVHWPFHALTPCVLVDGMDIWNSDYEVWRINFDRHAYRKVNIRQVTNPNTLIAHKGARPKEADYPGPLKPIDDLPPITVITQITAAAEEKVLVRGTTADNGTVKRVVVNGREARSLRADFAEWEAMLPGGEPTITAHAEDAAGNVERQPHVRSIRSGY